VYGGADAAVGAGMDAGNQVIDRTVASRVNQTLVDAGLEELQIQVGPEGIKGPTSQQIDEVVAAKADEYLAPLGVKASELYVRDEQGEVVGINREQVTPLLTVAMQDPQLQQQAAEQFGELYKNATPEVQAQMRESMAPVAEAMGVGGGGGIAGMFGGLLQGFQNLPMPAQMLLIGAIVAAVGGVATGNTGTGLMVGAVMAGLGLAGGMIPGMGDYLGNVFGGG